MKIAKESDEFLNESRHEDLVNAVGHPSGTDNASFSVGDDFKTYMDKKFSEFDLTFAHFDRRIAWTARASQNSNRRNRCEKCDSNAHPTSDCTRGPARQNFTTGWENSGGRGGSPGSKNFPRPPSGRWQNGNSNRSQRGGQVTRKKWKPRQDYANNVEQEKVSVPRMTYVVASCTVALRNH